MRAGAAGVAGPKCSVVGGREAVVRNQLQWVICLLLRMRSRFYGISCFYKYCC